MRDRIPLPADEPVVEDLMQVVGFVAIGLGLANHFIVRGQPLLTGILILGGLLWYGVGAYLKAVR